MLLRGENTKYLECYFALKLANNLKASLFIKITEQLSLVSAITLNLERKSAASYTIPIVLSTF